MSYYDRSGKRLALLEWAALMEDGDYRRVGYDEIGQYRISTVWLGIDHSFGRGEVPIIFETMVFDTSQQTVSIITGETYDEDVEQWRYPTEMAAHAGHDQAVAWARERVHA